MRGKTKRNRITDTRERGEGKEKTSKARYPYLSFRLGIHRDNPCSMSTCQSTTAARTPSQMPNQAFTSCVNHGSANRGRHRTTHFLGAFIGLLEILVLMKATDVALPF